MAYDQRREHFADPDHPLQNTRYSDSEIGHCSICLLKLAGFSGYGCYSCNIHLHSACADYFQETVSFFAHPSHTLKLSRCPERRRCDICRGDCPHGSFVYRCTDCGFDVHPLCSMLPERVACPFRAKHAEDELCMVSSESPGNCSACRHALPRWHYDVNSSFKLHITCAVDMTTAAGGGLGSNGHSAIQSSYDYDGGAAQGSHGTGQRSLFDTRAPAGGHMSSSSYYGHGYGGGPVTPAAGYNHGIIQGGYAGHGGQAVSYYSVPPIQGGGYAPPPIGVTYQPYPSSGNGGTSSGQQQGIFNNPSNTMSGIARFLVGAAISAVAGDLFTLLLSSLN